MTSNTVRCIFLLGVPHDRGAPHICFVRYRFKMVWVYAVTDPAKVIDLKTFGDGLPEKPQGHAMRISFFSVEPKLCIPIWLDIPSPSPTAVFVLTNVAFESLYGIVGSIDVSLPEIHFTRPSNTLSAASDQYLIRDPSPFNGTCFENVDFTHGGSK